MKKEENNRKYIVVDGLDGIGKGEIERALIAYEQRSGKAVFDSVAFSLANRKGLPELKDFWLPPETYFDTIITGEPTYAGIGHNIRHEIVAKNNRPYSAEEQIQAYSLDRLIQLKRLTIPALNNGLTVIQSRCMASTLCYQSLTSEDEDKNLNSVRKRILAHEGNKLQLEYAPGLLIIPTIKNTNDLIKRIKARSKTEKDDNVIFENAEFQGRLKPLFEDAWLKKLFEKHGTRVEYLDAGISPEDTRRQATEIYKKYIGSIK